MPTIKIRDAVPNDAALILRFIIELATYENAEAEVEATVDTITSSIFGSSSCTQAIICEKNGDPIGFSIYFFNYSTWQAKNGLYLEDLYVTPDARGLGAGLLLLKHLAKIAVSKDCGRFQWQVLDWNKPAIDFYESVGAVATPEWIGYRLTGDTLNDFAKS